MTRQRLPRIRTIVVLLLLIAVGALAYHYRHALQRSALTYLVLHNDDPSDIAMVDLLETADDAGATVRRFWASDRIPQRAYSISYLRRRPDIIHGQWSQMRPLVMEGLVSGDLDVQMAAISILRRVEPIETEQWTLRMLLDVDPGVRRLALMYLADHADDPRLAGVFVQCLDDPDRAIVSIAAATLRSQTGLDFGIRYAADDETIDAGRRAWRDWWARNTARFPDPPASGIDASLTASALPAPSLTLRTLSGERVDLGELRGKIVVINFWATWCPPCADELPALDAMARRYADDLVVLGVSLDDAAPESDQAGPSPESVADHVTRFAERHELSYPIALDGKGAASRRFAASGLPTTVWIDREGIVRRRYVSPRSLDAMERIFAELNPNDTTAAATVE